MVRLTGVLIDAPVLVPVTTRFSAPVGKHMLPKVVMVTVTFMVWAGTPSSVTLEGLKLQSAPVGRPEVQLPGLEAVELVKFTV
jgi:hypothetical protein